VRFVNVLSIIAAQLRHKPARGGAGDGGSMPAICGGEAAAKVLTAKVDSNKSLLTFHNAL
jgi:hypothetical protein